MDRLANAAVAQPPPLRPAVFEHAACLRCAIQALGNPPEGWGTVPDRSRLRVSRSRRANRALLAEPGAPSRLAAAQRSPRALYGRSARTRTELRADNSAAVRGK